MLQFHHLDRSPLGDEEPCHPLQQALSDEGRTSYLIQALSAPAPEKMQLITRSVSWRQIMQMDQSFVLLIFRDLEPLEKALARQRQFINNLAHELRTPLAIVTGNLHRMRRKKQFSGNVQQSLSDAMEETQRIGTLVDNLLLLSELDTDYRRWKLQIDSLINFVDRWIVRLNPESKALLDIVTVNESDDFRVQLDQDAFHLILDNLFNNSRRFCRSKPSIEIRLVQTVSQILLHFIDDGPGINNDDHCVAVFERFSRIEEHRNADMTDGSGLGLSLVKSLMEGMGGSASCSSAREQIGVGRQGLVVTLYFPRHKSSPGMKSSI
ncbi:MAG: HAMP domain-containing sensor histidine kinase [Synechococcus sp. cluster3_bin.96]|nr:HAMP domain-containing sensor histidine kinase [Synechococcus sp. cluster3_bin.96]